MSNITRNMNQIEHEGPPLQGPSWNSTTQETTTHAIQGTQESDPNHPFVPNLPHSFNQIGDQNDQEGQNIKNWVVYESQNEDKKHESQIQNKYESNDESVQYPSSARNRKPCPINLPTTNNTYSQEQEEAEYDGPRGLLYVKPESARLTKKVNKRDEFKGVQEVSDGQVDQHLLHSHFTANTRGEESQANPSCFEAVILAASSSKFSSQHCSSAAALNLDQNLQHNNQEFVANTPQDQTQQLLDSSQKPVTQNYAIRHLQSDSDSFVYDESPTRVQIRLDHDANHFGAVSQSGEASNDKPFQVDSLGEETVRVMSGRKSPTNDQVGKSAGRKPLTDDLSSSGQKRSITETQKCRKEKKSGGCNGTFETSMNDGDLAGLAKGMRTTFPEHQSSFTKKDEKEQVDIIGSEPAFLDSLQDPSGDTYRHQTDHSPIQAPKMNDNQILIQNTAQNCIQKPKLVQNDTDRGGEQRDQQRRQTYQDSLESNHDVTPEAQPRRQEEQSDIFSRQNQNLESDCHEYDPTNVSHKQFFLPQAYPPVKRKSQLNNSHSLISASEGLPPKTTHNQNHPDKHDQSLQQQQMVINNESQIHQTGLNESNTSDLMKSQANNDGNGVMLFTQDSHLMSKSGFDNKFSVILADATTEHAFVGTQSEQEFLSFRQQTFKPNELKQAYCDDLEEERKQFEKPLNNDHLTTEWGENQLPNQNSVPLTSNASFDATSVNTRSVQELYQRNEQLQSRIWNLEKILHERMGLPTSNQMSQDVTKDTIYREQQLLAHIASESQSESRIDQIDEMSVDQKQQQDTVRQQQQNSPQTSFVETENNPQIITTGRQSASIYDGKSKHNPSKQFTSADLSCSEDAKLTTQDENQKNATADIDQNVQEKAILSVSEKLNVKSDNNVTASHFDHLQSAQIQTNTLMQKDELRREQTYDVQDKNGRNQDKNKVLDQNGIHSYILTTTDMQTNPSVANNSQPTEKQAISKDTDLIKNSVDQAQNVADSTLLCRENTRGSCTNADQKRDSQIMQNLQLSEVMQGASINHDEFLQLKENQEELDKESEFQEALADEPSEIQEQRLIDFLQSKSEIRQIEKAGNRHRENHQNQRVNHKIQNTDNQHEISQAISGCYTEPEVQSCENCESMAIQNESLLQENAQLSTRLNSLLDLMQNFDQERSQLRMKNDQKIDKLEQRIESLSMSKDGIDLYPIVPLQQLSQTQYEDQQQTIRQLHAHIRRLESQQLAEIERQRNSEENMIDQQNQSESHQSIPNDQQQDLVWKERVRQLEMQLQEARNFYLERLETLERTQQTFNGGLQNSQQVQLPGKNSFQEEYQQVTNESALTNNVDVSGEDFQQVHQIPPQAEKEMLYSKLFLLEQALQAVQEELKVTRQEKQFLSDLNMKLTQHTYREEAIQLDLRRSKQSTLAGAPFLQISQFCIDVCKDLNVFMLVDLRQKVRLVSAVARKAHSQHDVLLKDEMYRSMEEVVGKLTEIANIFALNQQHTSFNESVEAAEVSQFDQFMEGCIEMCSLVSQTSHDQDLVLKHLEVLIIQIESQLQKFVFNKLNSVQTMTTMSNEFGTVQVRNKGTRVGQQDQSVFSVGNQTFDEVQAKEILERKSAQNLSFKEQIVKKYSQNEQTEENLALKGLLKLQRFVRKNYRSMNFIKLFYHLEDSQTPGKISQISLNNGLSQIGFFDSQVCNLEELTLLRLLVNYGLTSDYLIDIKQLFESLESASPQPLLILQKTLYANSFSLRHITNQAQSKVLQNENARHFAQYCLVKKLEQNKEFLQKTLQQIPPNDDTMRLETFLNLFRGQEILLTKLDLKILLNFLQCYNNQEQVIDLAKFESLVCDLRQILETDFKSQGLPGAILENEIKIGKKLRNETQNDEEAKELVDIIVSHLDNEQTDLGSWFSVFNTKKSKFAQFDLFEKVMKKVKMPLENHDLKSVFAFLAKKIHGIKSEKDNLLTSVVTVPQYVAIADLQSELDPSRKESYRSISKQHAAKPCLISTDRAVTQASSSSSSTKQLTNQQNFKEKLVDNCENNDLQMNSIIQLEDQLHRQEMLKKRRENGEEDIEILGECEVKDDSTDQCSEPYTAADHNKRINQRRKNRREGLKQGVRQEKPTSKKMTELKKRIENLSRQAKQNQSQTNVAEKDLSSATNDKDQSHAAQNNFQRSTSEERATQTINQFKRSF